MLYISGMLRVALQNDYYPFGMLVPMRNFSSPEYRYGFNGMEADDKLKGSKNNYTTLFRQYDPRIGRWYSIDPIIKEYISPYNSMSNSPTIKVDPRGDDDYFDILGNYLGSDNKKTNTIIVIREFIPRYSSDIYNLDFSINSNVALQHDYTDLESFLYGKEDFANKTMIGNIASHYAEKLGIKGRIETYERYGVMVTIDNKDIYVDTFNGHISHLLNDAVNLQNAIVHEDDHRNVAVEDDLEHTNRYIKQIKHKTWKNTTKEFKEHMIKNIATHLKKSLKRHSVKEVENQINNFNRLSDKTGVEFILFGNDIDVWDTNIPEVDLKSKK